MTSITARLIAWVLARLSLTRPPGRHSATHFTATRLPEPARRVPMARPPSLQPAERADLLDRLRQLNHWSRLNAEGRP